MKTLSCCGHKFGKKGRGGFCSANFLKYPYFMYWLQALDFSSAFLNIPAWPNVSMRLHLLCKRHNFFKSPYCSNKKWERGAA